MVLKLYKKCIFCNFVLTLTKNLKSVEAIYIYASKSFYYVLSENSNFYYILWLTVLDTLEFETEELLILQLLVSCECLFIPL